MRARTWGRARLAWLLLAGALGMARADVKLPRVDAPPGPRAREAGISTRWPSVLPCARPALLTTQSEHPDDVLRWSNANGAQQTLDQLGDPRARKLLPTFDGALPTRLAWVTRRPLRPPLPYCPHEDSCSRQIDLRVVCAQGRGAVGWLCDDGDAVAGLAGSCYPSVTYAYPSAAVRRAHFDVDGRVARLLRDPKHARDTVVGWALQLIEDACGMQRCAEPLAAAAASLRAVRAAPAWTGDGDADGLWLSPQGPYSIPLLRCSAAIDSAIGASCELKLESVKFEMQGGISELRETLEEPSSSWFIAADQHGLSLHDGAMR